MSHDLEIKNGQASMFSVKETPWHGLGHIIQEAPSIEEGIRLAGLDWKVALKPVGILGSGEQTLGYNAIVREDTGKSLGVVGPKYKPLQNKDAFNFFNPFIQSGQAKLETAGCLKDGKKVWILAEIVDGTSEVMNGDQIKRYVLLSDDKSGKQSVRVGFTTVRVVCQNTLSMAHQASDSNDTKKTLDKLIRVRHTGQVVQNLESVRELMDLETKNFLATMDMYKQLTRRDINQADIQRFVEMTWFSNHFDNYGQINNDKLHTRTANRLKSTVEQISELVETGMGSDINGVKGTVWGLYNAGTEFLTHHANSDNEKRLNSLWFGDNEKVNAKMLDLALKMATA